MSSASWLDTSIERESRRLRQQAERWRNNQLGGGRPDFVEAVEAYACALDDAAETLESWRGAANTEVANDKQA